MQPDDRSSLAKGIDRASQITTMALMLVLPGIGGIWLDNKYLTEPLFTLVGFVIGMAVAALQLYKLVKHIQAEDDRKDDRSQSNKNSE